jgi:hypothetical protein
MLVTIIGLSALAVARVKLQVAGRSNEAAAARLYAESGVEAALLAIYSDATWRDSTAHDTWQTPQAIGDGTFTWKLVDEAASSFTADRNRVVRAYGKGVCGDSVWIYSVQVQPPLEGFGSNSLVNGDLETGVVSPWVDDGNCRIKIDDFIHHDGLYCLLMWQRGTTTSAARQTISSFIQPGSTCRVQAWVRTRNDDGETIKVGAWVQSAAGWDYYPIAEMPMDSTYRAVQGTFQPLWSGALLDAYLEIGGMTTYVEIAIDDVTLSTTPPPVGPIPGTWRREAQ